MVNNNVMDYGKRFRLYRDKAGLTQKEAAERLGITPYQLGNYETNRSEPNIATLKKMSQVYQVSLDRLLGNRMLNGSLPNVDASAGLDINELKEQVEAILQLIEDAQ